MLNVATGAGPWLLDRLWLTEPGGGGSGGTGGGSSGGAGGTAGQGGASTPPGANDSILGFEDPALWSASGGVLASSEVHLQGAGAVEVSGIGYAEITSAPLTTLTSLASVIGFDISVPDPAGQVWWWGSAGISIECPSKGIYGRWLGQQQLDGSTLDRFRRIEVNLPDDVKNALSSGAYSDLRVKVILTVPQGSGPYILDRFTFASQQPEPAPPAPSEAATKAIGFETLEAWKASAASVSLSSNALEGSSAIALSNFTYTELTSQRLSSLGSNVGSPLTVNVFVPTPASPSWAGTVALSLDMPSAGIYSQWIGQHDLQRLTPDTWHRLTFELPSGVVSALRGNYSDLRIKLLVNRPEQSSALLFDELTFDNLKPLPRAIVEDYVIPLPKGTSLGNVMVGQALVKRSGFPAGDFLQPPSGGPISVHIPIGQTASVVAPRMGRTGGDATVIVGNWSGDVSAFLDVGGGPISGTARAGRNALADATSQLSNVNLESFEAGRIHVEFPATVDTAPDIDISNFSAEDPFELVPGAHGFVSAAPPSDQERHLRLRSGTYYLRGLALGGHSRDVSVTVDNTQGPVFIHVRDSLALGAGSWTRLAPQKHNVLLTYAGRSEELVAGFDGTLLAPRVRVIRSPSPSSETPPLKGSVFARSLDLTDPRQSTFHAFERDDCASLSKDGCGVFGCETADADADGLYDCEEQPGAWADPNVFNGMRVRAATACRPQATDACATIDTLAEVNACSDRPALLEQNMYSGWALGARALQGVGCQDEMNFWPPWAECTDAESVSYDYSGYISLTKSGTHCFALPGTAPSVCGSLFLSTVEGFTTEAGTQCFDLAVGVHPIRWFVEAPQAAALDRIRVNYCYGGSGQCTPTDAIPQAMLRPSFGMGTDCTTEAECAPTQFCSQSGQCRDDVEPCGAEEDCALGDLCVDGSCTSSICLTSSRNLACGYAGAPCECEGVCETDADCTDGKVCVEDAGTLLNLPAETDVCLPPICVPNCADKQCGDSDLSDGCTGFCTAVCEPGETGCAKDSDCTAGHVCRGAACVPFDPCGLPNLAPPDCGTNSVCGACPPSVIPACDDRACGVDPETGVDCGGCPATHFCNGAGQCARLEKTPPITVPSVGDQTREVVAPESPPAPELFGGTPGAFIVSDRGSAMYSIALEVPPGRAGIQPALSLRYTSSTGNGALGVGWSLDGFSSVTRCQRTYAQDGYTMGVKGTDDDAFCLDGQRLVPHGAGEYRTQLESFSKIVVDGRTATGPLSFKVYAKDGRILTYGGTAQSRGSLRGEIVGSWQLSRVEDRSGNFMRISYERTTSSSSVAGEESTSEIVPKAVTYTGHGSSDGDREVLFAYDTTRPDLLDGFRAGGGAFARIRRLTQVDVRAQNALVRRDSLTYETAPNGLSRIASIQECAGATASFCKHPTEVDYYDESGWEESYVRIIPPDANSQLAPPFPPYGIVHKSSEGRDLITALTLDSTPYYVTPLPQYLDVAISFIPTAGPYAAKLYQALQVLGMQTRHFNWFEAYTLDLVSSTKLFGTAPCNGGRWAPIMHVIGNGAYGEEKIHYQCPTVRTLEEDQKPLDLVIYKRPEWLLDLDGDGVQDILYCAEEAIDSWPYPFHYSRFREMHLDYKLATAAEQVEPKPPVNPRHEDRDGEIPWFGDVCKPPKTANDSRQFSMLFDVDGDGAANLVVYDSVLRWMALVRNAEGEFEWRLEPMLGLSMKPSAHTITILDVNGDGLRDLMAEPHYKVSVKEFGEGPDAVTASRTPLVGINTGRGFREILLNPQDPVNGGRASSLPAYAVDLNRDGMDELVLSGETGQSEPWRRRRMVNGTLVEEELDLVAGPGVLGDFDGDGNVDAFTQVKDQPHRVHPGRGRRQNLLKSVTDGTGHRTEVSYDQTNLSDEPTFNKFPANGDCRWPQRCQTRVEHALVSSHVESHFEDQARSQSVIDSKHSYSYAGAQVDVGGYGWLGFSERTVIAFDGAGEFLRSSHTEFEDPAPWQPGTTTTPYYYTKVGLPKVTEEVLPHADSALSVSSTDHLRFRKEFEWTEATSASGRPYVYLSKTTATTTNVVNSTVARRLFTRIATSTQDVYGNVIDDLVTSFDLDPNGEAVEGTETKRRVTTTFEPTQAEVSQWLISLPKREVIRDTPRCTDTFDCAQRLRERVHTFEYYPNRGLPRLIVRQPDDHLLQQTTELERDDKGNVTSVTVSNFEGDTRQITTQFDERGLFPISVTHVGDATEQQTQVRFDDRFGTLATRADPNGIDETWSHDVFGVQRTYRGPSGESRVDYEGSDVSETSDGFPILAAYQITSSQLGGARVEEQFSSLGQLVRRKSFGLNGAEVLEELAYDERQLLRERRRPHLEGDLTQGSIHYSYDELDRLVSEEYPDGAMVEHQHISVAAVSTSVAGAWLVPGAMNITRTLDPRLNASVQVTDRDGLVVHVVDALDQGTRYTYGAFGQLTRIVDAGSRSITLVHDAFGRTLRTTDAAHGGTQVSDYNGLDELVRTTDAAARERDYQYDAYGRLVQTDDDDGTTTFTYDGSGDNEIGRLIQTTGPTGQQRTLSYEPRSATRNRGLLHSSTDILRAPDAPPEEPARELTTGFKYDDFSRLERVDYPTGAGLPVAVEYAFDGYGHTTHARNANDPAQVYWQLVSADQGYRIRQERFGTHSCGASTGTLTTRDYDPSTGSLKTLQTRCGAQTLQSLSYDYDLAGNLTTRSDSVADTFEEYSYDPLNRPTTRRTSPTGAFGLAYAYDSALGRLTSQAGVGGYAYAPDGRDWIASAGSHTYDRDAIGNVTNRSGPSVPGGSQIITYTTQNLPSQVTSTSGETRFSYSAAGQRVVKQTPTATTFYLGDLYQRTEGIAATDHRFMVHVGGRAIAELTAPDGGEATVRYLHGDVLGSNQTTTTSAGTLAATSNFGPFGAPLSAPSADASPYGFTGHEGDDDLGLVNMKGRMYDPTLGQFLSPDPIVAQPYSQGLNRFAYVNNSPLNFTDPSGYTACPNRGGHGCSASSGPGYTALGIGAGAIAVGAAGYGAAQLWAGPQAITAGGATFSPGSAGGGGAAEELAVLGPDDAGGAVPGIGNLASAADALRFNSQLDARQRTVRMGLKPAGNANVATNGGVPGRAAGADSAVAPVREGAPPAVLNDRSRFAGAEYAIIRALNEKNYDLAIGIARQFWGANPAVPASYEKYLVDRDGRPAYGETRYYARSGAVTISVGPKGVTDARVLLSTMYHEEGATGSHVAQAGPPRNFASDTRPVAVAVNELQAYRAERAISSQLGLSQVEIGVIDRNIQENLQIIQGTPYAPRVAAGNYTLFDSDLATP